MPAHSHPGIDSSGPAHAGTRLEAAYALHLPAILALDDRDAPRPRCDVAAVSAGLLAALPALELELAELASLPRMPADTVRELPTRIMAMVQAQAFHAGRGRPRSTLVEALARGRHVRGLLLRAATTLADFERLPVGALAAIRSGRGHHDVAIDLIALAGLFEEHWTELENATAVPRPLVIEAAALGDAILTGIGEMQRVRGKGSEATLLRNRAFAHFMAAYRPTRRGLDFLYGEERSLELLPNVFDWRRFGKRRVKAEVPVVIAEGAGEGAEPLGPDR